MGFVAFNWLLGHVPTAKVGTYAYVNPIIAVFVGWCFGEPFTPGFSPASRSSSSASIWSAATMRRPRRSKWSRIDASPQVRCSEPAWHRREFRVPHRGPSFLLTSIPHPRYSLLPS